MGSLIPYITQPTRGPFFRGSLGFEHPWTSEDNLWKLTKFRKIFHMWFSWPPPKWGATLSFSSKLDWTNDRPAGIDTDLDYISDVIFMWDLSMSYHHIYLSDIYKCVFSTCTDMPHLSDIRFAASNSAATRSIKPILGTPPPSPPSCDKKSPATRRWVLDATSCLAKASTTCGAPKVWLIWKSANVKSTTKFQWFCPHTLGRYPRLPQTPTKKEIPSETIGKGLGVSSRGMWVRS